MKWVGSCFSSKYRVPVVYCDISFLSARRTEKVREKKNTEKKNIQKVKAEKEKQQNICV